MPIEILIYLAAIFVLLLLSAFFSGSETALTAVSRARMHSLAEEGNVAAKRVNALLDRPERLLGAVLLGNTLVDALAAALATALALRLVGEVGVVYATASVTLLIVVFGAVLPKTYALAWSDRVSLFVAPIMRGVITVLTPFTILIQFVVRFLLKLTPTKRDDAANVLAAHEEIRGTIELQKKEGVVARHDADMLGGVLDLRDLQVSDIMIHRTKMDTADIDESPSQIISSILKGQYTRVPLWRDEPENIVGVLNVKDLLAALAAASFDPSKVDIKALAQEPWFVPDTTTLREQLNQFLKRKAQMALVVDEYGTVLGLITLEDILEEIVGQIADEHDVSDAAIRPQVDGSVNVDGSVPVRDLNRQMHWSLPDEEATTIAGLVIHEAQSIPESGQAFTFYGYRFEVLRKNRNKITALRVRPLTPAAAAGVRTIGRPGAGKARDTAQGDEALDGG